jgi:hypothetical protein
LSVQLLSSAIKDGNIADVVDSADDLPNDPIEKNTSFSNEGFDRAFESAWERLGGDSEPKPKSRKTMDQLISEGLDRAEC